MPTVKPRPRKSQASRRPRTVNSVRSVLDHAARDFLLKQMDSYDATTRLQALRESQEELEESRHHYANLFDFAPVGYLTLDRMGVIRVANLTVSKMLGHRRPSLIGRPLLPMIASCDHRKFMK